MSICFRSDSWYILPNDSFEAMFLYALQQQLFGDASTLVELCLCQDKNNIFAAKTDKNYHADPYYVDVNKYDLNSSKTI